MAADLARRARDPGQLARRWRRAEAALFGLALALRLGLFALSVTGLPPSADESANALLARRIAQGERRLLFPGQPYLFPVEAYLLAPVVSVLPRSALGVRALALVLGLASVGGFAWLCRRVSPPGAAWPGILLLLFPSSYWLVIQAAYAPPNYAALVTFGWLGVVLAIRTRTSPFAVGWSALAGLMGGLAASSHTLSVVASAPVAAYVCLGEDRRRAVRVAPAYLVGTVAGLLPYWFGQRLIADYPFATGDHRSLQDAWRAFWNPAVTYALPAALGLGGPLFPDFGITAVPSPSWGPAAGITLLAVLGAATALRAAALVRRTLACRWIVLEPGDLFVLTPWLCLAVFAASRRSGADTLRYLLPLLWCLPFVASDLYGRARPLLRRGVAGIVVVLSLANLAMSGLVVRAWAAPGFGRDVADIPDLGPALAALEELEIRGCYASFWLAYRVTYETDERVVCSPPYNERFFDWPMPDKARVDATARVAYVLTDSRRAKLTSRKFERDLAEVGIGFRKVRRREFDVYVDFRSEATERLRRLDGREMMVTASRNARDASRIQDGDLGTRWSSGVDQEAGMTIDVAFAEPLAPSRLRVYYNGFPRGLPKAVRVYQRRGPDWEAASAVLPVRIERVRFADGRPLYGDLIHTISLPVATAVGAVRVEVAAPDAGPWLVAEIEVFVPAIR